MTLGVHHTPVIDQPKVWLQNLSQSPGAGALARCCPYINICLDLMSEKTNFSPEGLIKYGLSTMHKVNTNQKHGAAL